MARDHNGPNQGGVNANYGNQNFIKSNVHLNSQEADKSQHIQEFARVLPDPSSDKKFIADHHDGTGKWFLDLPEYRNWYNSTSTTLYVIGNPGVGKTVLAKFLVDELRKSENTKERIIYFFCKHQNKDHTSAVSILRSLIHQCMRLGHSLWEKHVRQRYEGFGPKLCDSFGELCEIFAAIMSDTEWKSGDWYCVIDALDHCDEDQRKSLLESICNIRPMEPPTVNSERRRLNLRLLVTSRPCESISKLYSIESSTAIHFTDDKGESRNKYDIIRYIEDRIAELVKQNECVRDREDDVKKALKNGHGGVFRWAACMVTTLEKPGFDDVENTLEKRPPEVEEMFKGIVSSIHDTYKPLLEWVTLSCRALSVKELSVALKLNAVIKDNVSFSHSRSALSVESIKNGIWSCGGLLQLQGDKVVVYHQSAKEFLVSQRFRNQLPELHAKIAKACIVYLSTEGLERQLLKGRRKSDCRNDYEKRCENFPFLEYAASSWYKHVQEAERAGKDLEDLWYLIRDRFDNKPIMEVSFQIEQFSNRHEYVSGQMCSGLHICAHYGLDFFAKKWLDITATDPNVVDVEGRTALWWAAERNNESMVKRLLNAKRINPNIKEKKKGLSPLSVAVEEGRIDVVRILLEDKRVQLDSDDHDGRTPLSLAAGAGHTEVVRLLLGKDTIRTSIDFKDRISDQTPLLWAARKGHASVVELLLEQGASPNFKDSDRGRTSLAWAAVNGHEAVVTALLKDKEGVVDLLLRDGEKRSAFEWAAFRKEVPIANKILDEAYERLKPWAKSSIEDFLNPAAKFGKEAAMKLLLDRGDIDPNSPSQDGRKALSLAAEKGHRTIVRLLLDSGKVDLNAIDGADDQTPLHWAAKCGRTEIVDLLLERDGVDLNATDRHDTTALQLAKENGYDPIANSILKKMNATSPLFHLG